MYESSSNSSSNMGSSPIRKTRHKAPPTPPSPPEVPWGDRKPAAKRPPSCVFKHSPDIISDIEAEFEQSPPNKDATFFPKNSPVRKKTFFRSQTGTTESGESNGFPSSKPIKQGHLNRNHRNSNKMSKRELHWAAAVFVLIVMITVTITVVVTNQHTRNGNSSMNQSNTNGDGMSTTLTPKPSTNSRGSTATPRKISVRDEWELVRAAILGNNVTRVLLEDRAVESIPWDLFFYDHLISGLVFSEEERDWVTARIDDDLMGIEGMDGMSMESQSQGEFGRGTSKMTLTPNQKATAWLLFYDELKDPNESVWRWAMASIYYRMGGKNWSFHNTSSSENKWFTSAPLCEWERIYGSTGCEKHRQEQLPVELDFGDVNMVGSIALEFALMLEPAGSSEIEVPVTTIVRSIMLSDNQLTGEIPGTAFQHLMPSLSKLYLDNNQLTGPVPLELGGLDTLYVQNNALTGDWPEAFCESGDNPIDDFGLDCDNVECSSSCCGFFQCYYSNSF